MTANRPSFRIETEAEIVASIERGLADVAAGRTVPHNEAMARIRTRIEEAISRRGNGPEP